MSLYEYEAQMYAYRLKQVDKQHDMHLQAWVNHQATATKEQGKKQVPAYKSFKDFFDYDKQIREVEKDTKNNHELSEHQKRRAKTAKRLNERG